MKTAGIIQKLKNELGDQDEIVKTQLIKIEKLEREKDTLIRILQNLAGSVQGNSTPSHLKVVKTIN